MFAQVTQCRGSRQQHSAVEFAGQAVPDDGSDVEKGKREVRLEAIRLSDVGLAS